MVLTREYLANYPYLDDVIARDEKKLQKYRDNPPEILYGKVYGSNPSFPYEPRGFTVSGAAPTDSREWKKRVRELEVKLASEKKFYEQLRVEIDELISNIENPRDKMVFEYLYHDRMTYREIADKMFIHYSLVSKIVDKYVPSENDVKN